MKDIVKSVQQDFIAYQGSLTTPPCSEAVSWLVARHPMKISRHDVSFPIRIQNVLIDFSAVFIFWREINFYLFLAIFPDDCVQENVHERPTVNGTQLQAASSEERTVLLELLRTSRDEQTKTDRRDFRTNLNRYFNLFATHTYRSWACHYPDVFIIVNYVVQKQQTQTIDLTMN